MTDILTGWRYALPLGEDEPRTYGELLDKYLRRISPDRIPIEGGFEAASRIQDVVYRIDDEGKLLPEMNPGVLLLNGDEPVEPDQEAVFDLVQTERGRFLLLDLRIDRSDAIFQINLRGYNLRKWRKNEEAFGRFVEEAVAEEHGAEAGEVLKLDTSAKRKMFLRAVGRRIWEADFETYSRFIGERIRFKDGAETLLNIIEGRGGICSEKTWAMRMICEGFGFECEFLLAGPDARGRFPEERLREMIEERDFSFGKKYTNYWQHMALLCRADDGPVMIDVTNGNVPFLFLEGEEAEALIDSDRFVSVRMVDEIERFYYHRVPQDIPEALLMLMRDWIGAIDLIHVFEDDLGLLIRSDFFVYPLPWRDEAELEAEAGRWMGIVSEQGFKGFELLSDPRSPGPIWSELASKLPKAFSGLVEGREYLRERFNRFYADERPFEISLAAVKA